jgi:hypothetical protein
VDRAAKDLALQGSRRAVDRRLRANPVDDDPDEIAGEGRSVLPRDKADKIGKSDAPSGVKSYNRTADTISTLPDATKSNDRGGRRNRDRDRY